MVRVVDTEPAPSAAAATLRVSSRVVADCRSTALAMVSWWSFIACTTSAIRLIEPTAASVSAWIAPTAA